MRVSRTVFRATAGLRISRNEFWSERSGANAIKFETLRIEDAWNLLRGASIDPARHLAGRARKDEKNPPAFQAAGDGVRPGVTC